MYIYLFLYTIYIYIYICWETEFDTPIILWQYDWMRRTVQWSYLKFYCFWAPWVLYRQYAVVSTGGPWKRFPGPSGIWSNMEYPRKLWNPPKFSKIISLFSLHIGPWASQNLHMTCEHTPGRFAFSWTSKCCQLNTKGRRINTLKRNHLAPIWRCWLAGGYSKYPKMTQKQMQEDVWWELRWYLFGAWPLLKEWLGCFPHGLRLLKVDFPKMLLPSLIFWYILHRYPNRSKLQQIAVVEWT